MFLLPEWVQAMSILMNQAECSGLGWRIAAEGKGKIETSVAAGTSETSCLLFKGTYLDAASQSETVGQAQGNSKHTRKNGRGECSITTVLSS